MFIFIEGKISLNDFLPPHTTTNTRIMDATYLKREGKRIYGAKKIKNYINGSYEQLQDVLFTTENCKGLNIITDFKIINHNKRHLTKPQEIVKAIREGKIRRGNWLVRRGSKIEGNNERSLKSRCKGGHQTEHEFHCPPFRRAF